MPSDRDLESFCKSLFLGLIPEEMVFPFPRALDADQLGNLRLILQSLRRVAAQHVAPARIDEEHQIPPTTLAHLRELGLFGLSVPELYGGAGLSTTSYCRVAQEMAGIDYAIAVSLGVHEALVAKAILLFGSEEQKARFLPELASGQRLAAFCLSEPGAGSDAASIRCRAVRSADGTHYLVSGEKAWTTNGASADLLLVFAKACEGAGKRGKERMTALLVERGPGVRSGPENEKLGIRGSSNTSVFFDEARVPVSHVLGPVGDGFRVAMGALNHGRLALAACCVGTAHLLCRLAIDQTTTRRQFGRRLSEFGLVRDKLGWMLVDTYAAESMVYLTCGLVDRGVRDYSVEAACCKVFASDAALRAANEALQLAGGAGYMCALPYERLLRDARINTIFDGTNEILRLFISLSGMEKPSARLAQLSGVLRRPLRSYDLLLDSFLLKLRTSVYGERISRAHPLLRRETLFIEDDVTEFATALERLLRKHGRRMVDMQIKQCHAADALIGLYGMVATVSRATAALEQMRREQAERHLLMARAFVGASHLAVRRELAMLEAETGPLKAIADEGCERGCYGLDGVFEEPSPAPPRG